MPSRFNSQRYFTPPQVAERLGVATAKVIRWIRSGELPAINVANRGCTRPRYSVSPEALAQFEQGRAVLPEGGLTAVRLRRSVARTGKDYFSD